MRTLPADRKTAAMTNATIRPDIHQALDVHGDFGAERAFSLEVAIDHLTQLIHVGVREIANAQVHVDTGLLENLAGTATANAVDVGQTDLNLLLTREIDARNTSH